MKALSLTYISLFIFYCLYHAFIVCLSYDLWKNPCIVTYFSERWHFDWQFMAACKRVTERREVERDEGVGWLTGKISCGLSELSHWEVTWQPSDTDADTDRTSSTRILIIHTDTHITQPTYWHTDTHHIHKCTLALRQKKSARLLNWHHDASFSL